MSILRRFAQASAVLALLVSTTSKGGAQGLPFQCIGAGGVTPLQRSQGLTELAGDLVLKCIDGVSTPKNGVVQTVDIQIYINTQITSRLIGNAGATEALLLVDDPPSGYETVCPANTNCAVPNTPPYYGAGPDDTATAYNTFGRINAWQGTLAASNSIVFSGVPIDPPGTSGVARIIRIVNVRDNASALLVGALPTSLNVLIGTTPSQAMPITSNSQQTIGFVTNGLMVTQTPASPASRQQCTSTNGWVNGGSIRFAEAFSSAFKKHTFNSDIDPSTWSATGPMDQDIPGGLFNTESGFFSITNRMLLPGNPGLADFGTRVKVLMNNLQPGVSVRVPLQIAMMDPDGNPSGGLFVMTTSEAGPFAAVAGDGTYAAFTATSTATSVQWVWEAVAAVTGVSETATVPIQTSWGGPPNSPATGTNSFAGWFASTSNMGIASDSTSPIPRFLDRSVAAAGFTIAPCTTCQAPQIRHLSANPNTLSPANGKLVPVKVSYTVANDCDPALACSLKVSGNQGATGHGRAPDWQIIDAHHVSLRAELGPAGKARVYTISVQCTDKAGRSDNAKTTVTVPRHR